MPAAGGIGPPEARAAPAPPGDLRKNSPSAVLAARARATSALMQASPRAPDRMTRSPIQAPANRTPANARALRRAGIMRMRRVLAAIGLLAIVRSASTGMTVLAVTIVA